MAAVQTMYSYISVLDRNEIPNANTMFSRSPSWKNQLTDIHRHRLTPDFSMVAVQTENCSALGLGTVRNEIPTANTTFTRSPSAKISRPISTDTGFQDGDGPNRKLLHLTSGYS